jgi:hypothetical protein
VCVAVVVGLCLLQHLACVGLLLEEGGVLQHYSGGRELEGVCSQRVLASLILSFLG